MMDKSPDLQIPKPNLLDRAWNLVVEIGKGMLSLAASGGLGHEGIPVASEVRPANEAEQHNTTSLSQ